jgi:hypothetical protein
MTVGVTITPSVNGPVSPIAPRGPSTPPTTPTSTPTPTPKPGAWERLSSLRKTPVSPLTPPSLPSSGSDAQPTVLPTPGPLASEVLRGEFRPTNGPPSHLLIDLGATKGRFPLPPVYKHSHALTVAKQLGVLLPTKKDPKALLPNTELGGVMFAEMQHRDVDLSGDNYQRNGPIPMPAGATKEFKRGFENQAQAHRLRCPSNFAFQPAALMPPWIAEQHAC